MSLKVQFSVDRCNQNDFHSNLISGNRKNGGKPNNIGITIRLIKSKSRRNMGIIPASEAKQIRIWAKGTENLEAYLKLLESREYFSRFNKESNARARKLANEAIALDLEYGLYTDDWVLPTGLC